MSVSYNLGSVNKLSSFGKNNLTNPDFAILKCKVEKILSMIEKDGLDQILHFVSKRWIELSRDPNSEAMKNLPTDFWMNSVGGQAGKGRWITMLMYTENESDASAMKEVLLRWQSKAKTKGPDLIQINRK